MKRPAPPPPRSSIGGALFVGALKIVWAAFVIATPLLGAWVASSLAAYFNGPAALAASAGLLLFPGLPLLWDTWVTRKRGRDPKKASAPRILTFWDRFILRTLAVNLVFLGVLLGTEPAKGFTALSTRGDWMLDGRHGGAAEAARKQLFRAADRLEWLYLAVHENPFDQKSDSGGGTTSGTPDPLPSTTSTTAPTATTPTPTPADTAKPTPIPPPAPDKPASGGVASAWPLPSTLDPLVNEIPAASETSLESVARYIADRTSDPARRLKAAHDWVADRIAYDAPSYAAHRYPPQDAQTVFRTRTGVCAGYARVLEALGRALGVEVLYIVGDARGASSKEAGEGHAWNVAKLDGRYLHIDATWDSGYIDGPTFTKHYRSDYYLTPPAVFGLDHFPDEARWQLRDKPISRGEFMRQPMMTPQFYAEARELIAPDRSQVTVKGALTIQINNPKKLFTLADFYPQSGGSGTKCAIVNGEKTRVDCAFPTSGEYVVKLFSNPEQYGSFSYIGKIEANSGG
ncbi:MAG: transglutaminase domain-containing protein [Byssovorax sp.]